MTYPYDDEYMTYDYDEHRYVLTERACLVKGNMTLQERLNLGGVTNVERGPQMFLDEISDFVYSQISDFNSSQWPINEYILAKCPSARAIIMKAMLKQVDYVLVNGLLYQYSGIDLKKNTEMKDISDRYLAPLAKSVLSKVLIETGTPILYAGKYNVLFKPNYEKEEY